MNAPERLKRLRDQSDSYVIGVLIEDDSDVVRHEAAFILGDRMHGGTLTKPEEAFGTLCHSAELDPSILVRHEAALSLANFKTALSKRILERLLFDPAPEVQSSARYALEDMLHPWP